MNAHNVTVLYSEESALIAAFFQSINPPYTLKDIKGFNSIYRRIYPLLNRDEKRRSEEWVDHLIEHLERTEWAARIWGVV